jgi:hypothetical protein
MCRYAEGSYGMLRTWLDGVQKAGVYMLTGILEMYA